MARAVATRFPSLVLALALAAALCPTGAALAAGGDEPLEVEALLVSDAEASGRFEGIEVRVSRSPDGIEVEGRCPIDASRSVAWSVLTDYDGIDRFVSSMRDSRVTDRRDDEILVEQTAVGRMFLFSRRLRATLRVHEEPPNRIRFEDTLGRDFKSYRGEWRIEESRDGVQIVYRLHALPAFSIPDFVARGVFRSTARQLLLEVRSEIERRAALAAR